MEETQRRKLLNDSFPREDKLLEVFKSDPLDYLLPNKEADIWKHYVDELNKVADEIGGTWTDSAIPVRFHLFGSVLAGMALDPNKLDKLGIDKSNASDVDIMLLGNGLNGKDINMEKVRDDLRSRQLLTHGYLNTEKTILSDELTFRQKTCNIDITTKPGGLENSFFFSSLNQTFPEIHRLLVAVKLFVKKHEICGGKEWTPFRNRLSIPGFALFEPFTKRGAICGQAFLEFAKWMSEFPFLTKGFDLQNGGEFTRTEKNYKKNGRMIVVDPFSGVNHGKPSVRKKGVQIVQNAFKTVVDSQQAPF
ncbi:hypothetical protein M3Y97_01075100 [Aphelenchoides bicaudatus]|nr:hypothetical protein M3Y97_01075100 [Aphelenchoides bicaudatus]